MTLHFESALSWEDFVRFLEEQSCHHPIISADSSLGPLFPVRSIPFKQWEAPLEVKQLVRTLLHSTSIIDISMGPGSLCDDTLGALRQIHHNDPKYLPHVSYPNDPHEPARYLQGVSSRTRLYELYVRYYKRALPGRSGGFSNTTGYAEYTAGIRAFYNQGERARIAFDYVNGKLYFSPFHCSCWSSPAGTCKHRVLADEPLPGQLFSPWFWITDVPAR